MSDTERDWPFEEGGPQAQDGLRSDTGTSQGTPKEESEGEGTDPHGASHSGSRGPLGTETPGEAGAEQGSR